MKDQKSGWIWLDWMVFGIRTVIITLFIIYYFPMQDLFHVSYVWITFWIIAVYAIPLLFWRPGYSHVLSFIMVEIILSGSLSIYFVYMTQEGSGFFMIPGLMIGYLATKKMLKWFIPIGVITVALIEGFLLEGLIQFINLFTSYSIAIGFGFGLQTIISSNKKMKILLAENEKKNDIITEQNKTLTQYSEQIEQITLLEERSRLARELHDTVGHTFTSSIMSLDAGIALMDKDAKARERFVQLRNVMDQGLKEVRRNIHAMIDDEEKAPLAAQLKRVTSEFSTNTSTPIDFEVYGEEADIPGSYKIILIRCLQESLTNAKRHGEASHIDVVLKFYPRNILLSIRDNGLGSNGIRLGFGLRSMEERVNLMQGQLDVYSELGQGTSITCSIPLNQ